MEPVRLVLVGAGLIGRRHAEQIALRPETRLAGIVDPSPDTAAFAASHGVPAFADLAALLAAGAAPGSVRLDGVVIATPTQRHVANGLQAVAAGLPALIEKPIADEVEGARRLVEAAERAGVPLLVGHHRRHNPMIRKARDMIEDGRIGRILAVQATCWLYKPDPYFEPDWRRQPGAGPVLTNLIHDVDNLRFLCGEVASVQAFESHAVRGFAVEDTAGILLRFESGAIGTVSVSDAVVAPFSWELTSGENPAYPHTRESCYLVGGTHGALTVPSLDLWRNEGERSWTEPLVTDRTSVPDEDPLGLQIAQFARVIRGLEPPLVSGREGLRTLEVIAAAKEAARTGAAVPLVRSF